MKKLLLIAASLVLVAATAFGQAKKPSLMVIPSNPWCTQNGYMNEIDVQGQTIFSPDYARALSNDADLTLVISKIGGLMADRGFQLKQLKAASDAINRRAMENAAIQSKSGAEVQTNAYMEIRNQARADIILELTWKVNEMGPKRSITYILDAIDAYTSKQVASASGTGAPSFTAEVPVLLEEAVNSHMDEFCDRLQNHFDDLLENGREMTLNINVFDGNDLGIDLETEFDGKELREIIEDWVYENTVSHRYNLADDSELYMKFEEVRMPIYDEKGRPLAANAFARGLVKHLQGAPYLIERSKLMNKGLGEAQVIIGDK